MALALQLTDYVDIDAAAGGALSGEGWLRQAVRDVLLTPIGSCVMRRDYGSDLFKLIDAPMTPGLVADVVAASAEAIDTWLTMLKLKVVQVLQWGAGVTELGFSFDFNGQPLAFSVIL